VDLGIVQGRNLSVRGPAENIIGSAQIMGKKAKKKEGPSEPDLALWRLLGTKWEFATLNPHQELPRWRFTHPKGHAACFGMAWDYRRSSLSGASGWQDIN